MRTRLLLALVAAGCAGKTPDTSTPAQLEAAAAPATAAPAAPPVENVSLADVGLDAERLDRTADPCDDFFRFACGHWLDTTELPADEVYWGTFTEVERRNEAIMHKILDDATKDAGADPVTQKLGAFYGGCMDEAAIEKAGTKALEPLFAITRKVRDPASLMSALAVLHDRGTNAVFNVYPVQDKKVASRVIAQVDQAGLGLPDRDYYLSDDAKMKEMRAAYLEHVEKTLLLLGRKPAAARKGAADVLALETDLARSQKTRVERRDEYGTYNKVDRAGLGRLAPGLAWDAYFKELGLGDVKDMNVPAPKAIEALPGIMKKHKAAEWRDYLDLHVVAGWNEALPRRFDDEAFRFEQKLTGQKEQRARWKRCVSRTTAAVPDLVAQPFVKTAFPGQSKSAAQELVRQIIAAFGENLNSVKWMDEETKTKARDKLRRIDLMVGYPDRWRAYDFPFDKGSYAATLLRAVRWENQRQLAKIGKPLDRGDFQYPPTDVNAYYDPGLNQIVLLAGILQLPFYNVKSSVAVNLGGIGMVVGHELTHGFDDQGALYDGEGNLSGWWPDSVMKAFKDGTQCTSKYYSKYEVLPGLQLNGDLTNGENIADLGGVKLAFLAYRTLRKDAPTRVVADGFTEDQQFFLSMGQAWCEKESEEILRVLVATNPHSPPRFRVLGALSSLPAFGEAFKCKAGSKMRPENACKVW